MTATIFPRLPIHHDTGDAYAAAFGVLSALVSPEARAEADAYLARCRHAAALEPLRAAVNAQEAVTYRLERVADAVGGAA